MVHVALVFDSNIDYNRFALVCVDSIRRTTDAQVFFHFLVDRRNCRPDFIRLLEKLVARSGNYSEVIDVGAKLDKRFPNAKQWEHVSKIAFARFLIPELIDVNDRVIYLDCDIVVRRDLEQTLYKENIGDKPIGACVDEMLTCTTEYKVSQKQAAQMTRLREVFGIRKSNVCDPVFYDGMLVIERKNMPERTWMGDAIADAVMRNQNSARYSDMGAFDEAFAEKYVSMLSMKNMVDASFCVNNTDERAKDIQSFYGVDVLAKSIMKDMDSSHYKSMTERVMTDCVMHHFTGFKDGFFHSETPTPASDYLTMLYESAVRYAKG